MQLGVVEFGGSLSYRLLVRASGSSTTSPQRSGADCVTLHSCTEQSHKFSKTAYFGRIYLEQLDGDMVMTTWVNLVIQILEIIYFRWLVGSNL